ncbi:MAG: hypothetical protein MRZ28_02120, partial [Oscillospiraceae bacterium]|nr:hypothetical protein [Oscillospiraceae bacterium]MDY3218034.1 hypothetical protein [Candidatus Fimivivens sp.]
LAVMALNLKRMVRAIFNKLKIRFMWAVEVFPQPSFSFCQQVQSLTLPPLLQPIVFFNNKAVLLHNSYSNTALIYIPVI